MWAMRQFARCAEVRPQVAGYCHGSLASAAQLANHDVCTEVRLLTLSRFLEADPRPPPR